MAEIDAKLVQTIAAQVIAVLRERGLAGAQPSVERTHIQPPMGTCTGDYSKFPELKGKLYATNTETAVQSEAAGGFVSGGGSAKPQAVETQVRNEPVPLTGIVTANQLQAAIEANGGVAVLAMDARLSPLANDLARQHPERIRRLSRTSTDTAVVSADLPWMWWIDGHCPVVQELTTQLRDRLRPAGAPGTSGSTALPRVVRDLAGAVRNRAVAGGLLFVHNAARAACMANRCPSLRAVVGTCGEAVEQAIQEIGANVLVIEYPHHGLRSQQAMVERIMQQQPKLSARVERELADLQRCV